MKELLFNIWHLSLIHIFKQSNINQGIEEYKMTAGAVLLDVRTLQEYQEGHTCGEHEMCIRDRSIGFKTP